MDCQVKENLVLRYLGELEASANVLIQNAAEHTFFPNKRNAKCRAWLSRQRRPTVRPCEGPPDGPALRSDGVCNGLK